MTERPAVPFYLKISQILIAIFLLFYMMWLGQGILIPFAFAFILAILIDPVVGILQTKLRFPRVLAILTALILAIAVVSALVYFIASQASMFSDTFPALKQKLMVMQQDVIHWAAKTFNTHESKINAWLKKTSGEGLNNSTAIIGSTLYGISNTLVVLLLLPVYMFFILFYKALLRDFIRRLFPEERHAMVQEILKETNSLIQKYLQGLMVEAGIVAVLNSIGLLLIGIEYAILLGIIGALLNIIPYVGGLVAISLPVIIAIATKSTSAALLVIVMFLIVQFIDNNIIVPRIVASRIQLNGLVSILVVLIGGALFGVAGMFLSIPVTAILKVIFDRVDGLKPWGYLLGDDVPDEKTFRWQIRSAKKSKAQ